MAALTDAAPGEGQAHDAARVVVIPGTKREVADEVEEISPEGAPADAKAGPAALRRMMYGFVLVVVVAAAVSTIWLGWIGAVMALLFGLLGVVFNPALGAAAMRSGERKQVAARHLHDPRP